MKLCELCDQEASLHCASDSAFLCFDCDSKVHAANFLVARHLREPLCSLCKALSGDFVSGAGAELLSRRRRAICRSCSPESDSDLDDDSASSFSSSACISSTDHSSSTVHTRKVSDSDRDRDFGRKMRKIGSVSSSLTDLDSNLPPPRLGGRLSGDVPVEFSVGRGGDSVAAKRRGAKWRAVPDATAEGIFVNWCRKFGVDGNAVVSPASHALVFCLGKLTVLPFRVALAASFWFGLRLCGDRTAPTWQQQLRRLEEISGVPAKQILAVHVKLTRALRISREPHDLKEGWAESSA